jgi:penicillin amidase
VASVVRTILAVVIAATAACARRDDQASSPPPTAQGAGTLAVDGLEAPVRVVRDRWGVPHIYATSQNDLFFAQGFVQAQDRLFQMDLWRRAAQGRLSEVLGANFIERDAMTRRIQYAGNVDADWAHYGPDARSIAGAFVRGVNAWVARAREQPPELFLLAGWRPETWSADDLLNRTDAVIENAATLAEIARDGLGDVVADSIRRAGAPPFFVGLAAPVRATVAPTGQDYELATPLSNMPLSRGYARLAGPFVDFAESSVRLENPSARYVVHLVGPGWNVIGVTSPWRPGVAAGHNERVAWAFAPSGEPTQTVRAVPETSPSVATVTRTIAVKGRSEPFSFDTESTAEGIVIAVDRAAHRRFVYSWTGFEPGAAPEMLSLTLDRAPTRTALLEQARGWKLPARSFVAADAGAPFVSAPRGARDGVEQAPAGRRPPRALFAHSLGVTDAARRRFNIGPVFRVVNDQPVRLLMDARAWDQARAMNAPGQSENPDSAHFSDVVGMWSEGVLFPLVFSDAAVQSSAEATLTLTPRRRRVSP